MSGRANPAAVVAAGLLSLAGFAAAGWALRGLRDGGAASAPVPPAAVAAAPLPPPGKLVFRVHCARCHGPGGRGDGPDAAALRPPPRDLTSSPWRTAATRDSVRRSVTRGVPGTMMPPMAGALSPRELDAVVDFALALAPPSADPAPALLGRAGFTPAARGRPAPPFEARDASGGEPASGLRLRGSAVLLVFWGTSCAPCLKEMPALGALASRYRGRGLAVVPVCADETDPAAVARVARGRAPGLPVYVDPSGRARLAYDVQALPSAALIAPDGRLLATAQGSVPWSSPDLDALLGALLGPDDPRPE